MGRFAAEYGHIIIPALLGCAGVYLLLPKPRRVLPAFAGLLLCLGALGFLGGWAIARLDVDFIEKVLFYAFAGLAILGGGLLVTQRNPVHAAVSFVLVVLATCGIFLLMGAPFLAGATIIVYAGAIVVTFLFVIMLAQQSGAAAADHRSREPLLASVAGFVLIGALLCILQRNYGTRAFNELLIDLAKVTLAPSVDEVFAVMGDPKDWPEDKGTHPLVDKLLHYLPENDDVVNVEFYWKTIRQPKHFDLLKKHAAEVVLAGNDRRATLGSLAPAPLPQTSFAGALPSARLTSTKDGRLVEALPARNVAALGTALFTDHLVAIQIAGMLLLVATIGAIAIAGRAQEGLR